MAQRLIYIRHDTIKLLERNICKTSSNINPSNVFFSQSPRTIEIKAKVNKWNLIKLMNFCTAKEAGSYGSSNFWRNHHAIFHSNCANLHFYQQYMRFPFSLHPCQHLFSVFFLMIVVLTSVRWYLIVVFSPFFFLFLAVSHGLWDHSSLISSCTRPWQWKCWILTTEPPGNSSLVFFIVF